MGNIKNAEELYLKAYSICNEEKVKNSINTILRTIENNKFSKEIELAKQSGGDSFRKGYFHLGKIYAQNQNPEKGIEYILNALTEQPNNPLYLMELALLYSRTDQIRKADETLTKLEKITKNPILSEKITNLRTLLLNR
jgi:tetratricopeptide (TPR) repeat protein